MRRLLWGKRLFQLGLLALLLAVLGWGWRPALVWYCVHGLSSCEDKEQDKWLRRLEWLGERALPALVQRLQAPEEQVCRKVTAALLRLARSWGPADGRCQELANSLCSHFSQFSPAGRQAAFSWFLSLPEDALSSGPLSVRAADLVCQAAACEEAGVCAPALELVSRLGPQQPVASWQEAVHRLLCRGLQAAETLARLRAVQLLLQPAFCREPALLSRATPLLRDAQPVVRRAALLLVGAQPEIVSVEELLPLLHDPQAELRRLCETALRSRGLADEQIELARLVSDPRPAARLQVFYHLPTVQVDPAVWLQRLSQDPAPAVRAAALRAASLAGLDLGARLRQIAVSDPSPTVRQLAGYYLQNKKAE